MKKVILLFFMLLVFQTGFSQNIENCRDVVNLTIEAINSQSTKKLTEHLSKDFSIANQKGEVAKLVLNQLFAQLNETVSASNELSAEKNDNTLELKYNIEYEKMGNKTASFVFNQDNQLEQLELFKMEVKTLNNSKSEVFQPEYETIEIPFTLIGKLIGVEVVLNNQKRTFLLDSGSPKTILNAKYITLNDTINKKSISSVKGVGGSISGMDIEKIETLDFAGIKMENQDMLTLDISHLEKSLDTDTEIHGLIAYDLIKEYDILFDYENKKLTLIEPDFFDEYSSKKWTQSKLTTIPFELPKHIPIITATIGGKDYVFGLDCGAESNLMKIESLKPMSKYLKNIETDTLSGADKNSKEVTKGKIKKVTIGKKKFKRMTTVFSDISHLNNGYNLKLDGLMGYEMLSKQKTLISYKRKTLTLLE